MAYEIFIDESGSATSDGMSGWLRRVERRLACSFLVADESGEARIDTSGPLLMSLVPDPAGATRWLGRYPGKHRALGLFLESEGFVPTNWLGLWKPFRYAEGVLEEGERVSVAGGSAPEVDATGDRRGPRLPPERLVLRGTEAVPLLISDAGAAHSEPGSSEGGGPR